MALIKCPECGWDKVSGLADKCPQCGYPLPNTVTTSKPRSKRHKRPSRAANGAGSIYNTGRPHKPFRAVATLGFEPVSYTHLDVYKRQVLIFKSLESLDFTGHFL